MSFAASQVIGGIVMGFLFCRMLGLFTFMGILTLALPSVAVDSCLKNCVIDADCGLGGTCQNAVCVSKSRYCGNELWSINERGEKSNCDAYRCDSSSGLCLRSSAKTDDCTSGYVFDGQKSCVPSVNCGSADPNCVDLQERWKKAREEYESLMPEPSPVVFTCETCTQHDQCVYDGAPGMCWQNRCVRNDFYCAMDADGGHFVASIIGVEALCGNYSCDPIQSACFQSCLKPQDCRSGKSCVSGLCL